MPEHVPAHGVVVLAAGASQRLGQPKQLLVYRNETLVHRAARLAIETRARDAVIVLGHNADSISAQVEDLPIRRVDCIDWRLGLGASLRAGVDALRSECAGVLVLLCDQPGLDAKHLASLCRAWGGAADRGAASFYANRLGVPALLPRPWFDELDAGSDRGMRDLLAQRADQFDAVVNEALVFDVDRPDDLRHLS